tara:strand:+ start:1047 stop:1733 length:687 start_codon:yes stop_codon:yes gene_type:complete
MELINKEFTIQGDFVKQAYGGDDWSREEWLDLVVKVKQEMDEMKKENEKLKEKNAELEKEVSLINSEEMENEEKIAKLKQEHEELKEESDKIEEIVRNTKPLDILDECLRVWYEDEEEEEEEEEEDEDDMTMEQFLETHNITKTMFDDIRERTTLQPEQKVEPEPEQDTHFFTYDENGVEFFKTIEELFKSPARKEDMYVYVGELNEEEYDDDEDDYREMTALDYIQK